MKHLRAEEAKKIIDKKKAASQSMRLRMQKSKALEKKRKAEEQAKEAEAQANLPQLAQAVVDVAKEVPVHESDATWKESYSEHLAEGFQLAWVVKSVAVFGHVLMQEMRRFDAAFPKNNLAIQQKSVRAPMSKVEVTSAAHEAQPTKPNKT
eukprot:3630893-Amphidinium_carterae.1